MFVQSQNMIADVDTQLSIILNLPVKIWPKLMS